MTPPSFVDGQVRNVRRLRQVQSTLFRYGFDIAVDSSGVYRVGQLFRRRSVRKSEIVRKHTTAERLRLLLEELGPTYIKLGQILASRTDMLPADWTRELANLRDSVATFPAEQVLEVLHRELGENATALFADFDPAAPVAAASIGQVHAAKAAVGRQPVVIKIQRPDVENQVYADIEIIRDLARILEDQFAIARDNGLLEIVDEVAQALKEELDYHIEARNAMQLAANMARFPGIHVPHIYQNLSTRRVLTMERISGIKIIDVDALDAAGLDRVELAERFVRVMFHQVLADGFFHADPHPGNFFVDPQTGVISIIDLGMMGYLGKQQREAIGSMVLAIQGRDAAQATRITLKIGLPYHDVNKERLQTDIDRLMQRYLSQSLAGFSFSEAITDIMSIAQKHGLRMPASFSLAGKAASQAEEIARILNPDIEIQTIVRSVAETVIKDRLKPPEVARELFSDGMEAVRLVREMPVVAEDVLKQMQEGRLRLRLYIPGLDGGALDFRIIASRLTAGLIVAGMAIGSATAMSASPADTQPFIPVIGTIGFILSMVLGGLMVVMVFWDLWRANRLMRRERRNQR